MREVNRVSAREEKRRERERDRERDRDRDRERDREIAGVCLFTYVWRTICWCWCVCGGGFELSYLSLCLSVSSLSVPLSAVLWRFSSLLWREIERSMIMAHVLCSSCHVEQHVGYHGLHNTTWTWGGSNFHFLTSITKGDVTLLSHVWPLVTHCYIPFLGVCGTCKHNRCSCYIYTLEHDTSGVMYIMSCHGQIYVHYGL